MTVIASQETSLNSIKLLSIHLNNHLMITSSTQEWCSIWNKFLPISLKQKNTLKSNSKEESQIKSLTSTSLMIERFSLLQLFGMILPMTEGRKPTLWTTFWAIALLKLKRSKSITLESILFLCFWNVWLFQNDLCWPTTQVCLSNNKNFINFNLLYKRKRWKFKSSVFN